METTILQGYIGLYRDNGKENGSYYSRTHSQSRLLTLQSGMHIPEIEASGKVFKNEETLSSCLSR